MPDPQSTTGTNKSAQAASIGTDPDIQLTSFTAVGESVVREMNQREGCLSPLYVLSFDCLTRPKLS